MNKSNIEHAIAGLFLQVIIWLATDSLWLGFVFVTGLFLGREHAQFEYKLGNPSKLKGYEAFAFWKWSLDSKLDFILPVLVTLLVALGGSHLNLTMPYF